ncbi:hypothetical protein C8F04DRAFT_1201840 [Mycena alexandri]|uniref:Uncharacterized protein n=1 Tax=Mycena alexandri TaxID=1745969 RepID=A0AAD6RWI0_9AGAR|nr:hypothetical protein C8F04DRAFT_1201840 [Mycena alexandri]
MKIALLLVSLPVVRADKVCITSDSGTTVCQNKLTRGTIAAIICTVALLLVLILGAVAFLLYRRRQFVRARSNIAADACFIEASQMQGPPTFTTYSAPYDSKEVPIKPSSAAKPTSTTYAGVTYPFPGFASGILKPPTPKNPSKIDFYSYDIDRVDGQHMEGIPSTTERERVKDRNNK